MTTPAIKATLKCHRIGSKTLLNTSGPAPQPLTFCTTSSAWCWCTSQYGRCRNAQMRLKNTNETMPPIVIAIVHFSSRPRSSRRWSASDIRPSGPLFGRAMAGQPGADDGYCASWCSTTGCCGTACSTGTATGAGAAATGAGGTGGAYTGAAVGICSGGAAAAFCSSSVSMPLVSALKMRRERPRPRAASGMRLAPKIKNPTMMRAIQISGLSISGLHTLGVELMLRRRGYSSATSRTVHHIGTKQIPQVRTNWSGQRGERRSAADPNSASASLARPRSWLSALSERHRRKPRRLSRAIATRSSDPNSSAQPKRPMPESDHAVVRLVRAGGRRRDESAAGGGQVARRADGSGAEGVFGEGREVVGAVHREGEVKQLVVADRRTVVLFERLGRDAPAGGADATGHEQRNDVVVGGLADLFDATRAPEGVVRQRGLAADHQCQVVCCELDLATCGASRLDRGHRDGSFRQAA